MLKEKPKEKPTAWPVLTAKPTERPTERARPAPATNAFRSLQQFPLKEKPKEKPKEPPTSGSVRSQPQKNADVDPRRSCRTCERRHGPHRPRPGWARAAAEALPPSARNCPLCGQRPSAYEPIRLSHTLPTSNWEMPACGTKI
jgi:rubredoxin